MKPAILAALALSLAACDFGNDITPCEVRTAAVCERLGYCDNYYSDCYERNLALCDARAVDFTMVRAEVCAMDIDELDSCAVHVPVSCDLNRED